MSTSICPACGYPTLEPVMCAFCCPGEVRNSNLGFGVAPLPTTTPHRDEAWLGLRDSDSHPAASALLDRVWRGPVAS